MPQLGETVTEGTILRWAKSVGDSVAPDEVLVEISTDKVDTEVPSPVGGTIVGILVAEGETVEVGTPLVVIGEAGEAAAAPPSPEPRAASSEWEAPVAPVSPEPARAGLVLSPVVRKLIREHNLDPVAIVGTGRGGRVTRRDVEEYIAGRPEGEPSDQRSAIGDQPEPVPAIVPASAPAAVGEPVAPAAVPPAAVVPPVPVAVGGGSETVELSRLRVRIGENMIRAKQTAAHVWTSVEVDYERLERVRQRHKAAFKAAEGFSLTYLPFIARATVDALQEFPVVNSEFHLDQKQAVFHKSVNLGIAIDVDQQGLLVATIRNAESLRLVGLARQIRSLADKARSGRLEPDDVTGSTFSLTNPGPFGSFMSAPIINVPNTGILSTDTVSKRPSVVAGPDGSDVMAIRHIGYLGLTWDHRAFDGSTAVLFLRRIKDNLETWDWEQELA
jgi:2-oxoglutarate dehydrogenase E2 component (dihydrolipoamide succinyltransferase)